MEQYYKPSGKFSPVAIILFIIACAIILPLLGVAYAYSIWYMPIIYLAVLMNILFGLAVGYVISLFAIKWGKVRNLALATLMGFLGALIALYLHWSFWVTLVENSGMGYSLGDFGVTVSKGNFFQALQLALNPAGLFNVIQEINVQGTWTLKGNVVSGTFLTVIWILEALIVMIASIYMTRHKANKPFSESSETWFKEKEVVVDLIENKSPFILSLEKGQFEVLNEFKKNENQQESHTILTVYYTETGNFYLSAINKFAAADEKGKVAFSEDPFLEYIMIDSQHGQKLLALS